jgi:hypothetical protein
VAEEESAQAGRRAQDAEERAAKLRALADEARELVGCCPPPPPPHPCDHPPPHAHMQPALSDLNA